MINRGISTTVGTAFDKGLEDSPVSFATVRQCLSHSALTERFQLREVWEALHDPEKHVVIQTAPAIRVSLGEELGEEPGTIVTGKMVGALRKVGFDKVFDTDFTADLTIMEEGHEFLERLNGNGKLPLLTSCSPGWINYVETLYPEFLDNVSSCKSPQQMFGAVIKTYYAKKFNIDPATIFTVSAMPCTAKSMKQTGRNEQFGYQDVDAV